MSVALMVASCSLAASPASHAGARRRGGYRRYGGGARVPPPRLANDAAAERGIVYCSNRHRAPTLCYRCGACVCAGACAASWRTPRRAARRPSREILGTRHRRSVAGRVRLRHIPRRIAGAPQQLTFDVRDAAAVACAGTSLATTGAWMLATRQQQTWRKPAHVAAAIENRPCVGSAPGRADNAR
jgi:hypothetical protein